WYPTARRATRAILVWPVEVAVRACHVQVAAGDVDSEARRGPEARDDRPVGEVERLEPARQDALLLALEPGGFEGCTRLCTGAPEIGEECSRSLTRPAQRLREVRAPEEVDDAQHVRGRLLDRLDAVRGRSVLEHLVAEPRVLLVAPADEVGVAAGADETTAALHSGHGLGRRDLPSAEELAQPLRVEDPHPPVHPEFGEPAAAEDVSRRSVGRERS